ncbi:hypothetical protein EV182_005887 [Spiromyces aspiralis]|uniref:Uncharacterized protein n=1 Tax=Spiromyces aspiralis TaxID=68401 RepID=A0ACC1HM98_9FUNG|nr:hypothetical protein EV182_005887 [Spiromyces aspiralis]
MAQSNPGLGKRRVPSLTHTVLYTHKRARKAQRRASKMIRRGVVQMIQGGVKDPARPFLDYTRDDASSYDENFAISAATRSTGTQGLRLGRAHAHRHNNDSISRSSFSGSISSWFSKRPQITTHGTGPKDIANSGGGCDAPTTLRSLIDEMSKEDNCGDSLDQQHPLLHPPLPPFALAETSYRSASLPIDPRQLANYQRFSAEAQHILEADKYSDYSQAPMHKVDGVLDDSLYDFINPAVFGKLPTLWLPMKSTSAGTSKNSSASPPTALTQN